MPRTIAIFGGSSGIGAALARLVAAKGDRPFVIGRDVGRLAAIAAETGGRSHACDVREAGAIEAAVAAAGTPLEGLAYAIGSINLKPLARLTRADFEQDFFLNAAAAALAVQAALPALRAAENAAVLLFSTVAVQQGFTGHASISLAKGAVEGLTRALAAELAPKIRVNCIAPSLTRTPLAAGLTSNEAMATTIAGLHALPRLGEPEDAAQLGAFLLSPQAGWITGQVMGVDGGRSTLRTKG